MNASETKPTPESQSSTVAATPDLAGADASVRLASIIASSLDAISMRDLAGTVTCWSPGAEITFGYSARELLGQSVQMLVPLDRLHEEADLLQRFRLGQLVAERRETQRI